MCIRDRDKLLDKQLSRPKRDRTKARLSKSTNYYDDVLVLFGKGWLDGRYRFDEQGYLHTEWSK